MEELEKEASEVKDDTVADDKNEDHQTSTANNSYHSNHSHIINYRIGHHRTTASHKISVH